MFLSLGLDFTLQLNNVSLFNGSANIVPKILETGMSASVPFPKEAANSQVTGLLAVNICTTRGQLKAVNMVKLAIRFCLVAFTPPLTECHILKHFNKLFINITNLQILENIWVFFHLLCKRFKISLYKI